MRKIFILLLVIFALANVSVTASENLPSIYVMDNIYFGTDTDILSEQRMNYKEIENIVKESEDIIEIHLDNGILIETKKGEIYSYQNNPSSAAFINNELFAILSNKKWLEMELYKYTGIHDDIHSVMYKQNAQEYVLYGNTEMKDAWLFGNDNVYLADMTINDEHFAKVTDVCTYDEWYDLIEYKPIGKCVLDKRIIAENVYVNNKEAMIPMRAVVEASGGKVEWDEKNNLASIYYDGEIYVLKYIAGQNKYTGGLVLTKNGLPQALGRTSGLGNYCIDNGVTYLSFLTAKKLFMNMNIELHYNFADKTIEIIR